LECEEISKSDIFEHISKMIEYREGKASAHILRHLVILSPIW